MPQRIDLGTVTGFSRKRIVFRDRAIVFQTQDFSSQRHRILRRISARSDPQHVVGRDCEARGAVKTVAHEDIADVCQRAAFQSCTRYRNCRAVFIQRLAVRKVDPVVICEVRMDDQAHVAVDRADRAGLPGEVRSRAA